MENVNKKILVFLSKNDELIPYSLGENLVQEFKNKKYTYHVIVNNRLNHLLAGAYNLLNTKEYLTFLKE